MTKLVIVCSGERILRLIGQPCAAVRLVLFLVADSPIFVTELCALVHLSSCIIRFIAFFVVPTSPCNSLSYNHVGGWY